MDFTINGVTDCFNLSHFSLAKLKAFPLLLCLVCDWLYSHNFAGIVRLVFKIWQLGMYCSHNRSSSKLEASVTIMDADK
jgi:hypothetical protein